MRVLVVDDEEMIRGLFREALADLEGVDVDCERSGFRAMASVYEGHYDLVFTDIMMADGCSLADLQPVLDRIHLSSLGSPSFYKETADSKGLEELAFIDLSDHLVLHYQKILEETERREPELADNISQRYLDHMKRGLQHWVDSGARGDLVWGIFHFQKPKD